MGPKNKTVDDFFDEYAENDTETEPEICHDLRQIISEMQSVLNFELERRTFRAGFSAGYNQGVLDGRKFVGIDSDDMQEIR